MKTKIEIVIAKSKKIVNAVIVSPIVIVSVCLIAIKIRNLVINKGVIEIEQTQDVVIVTIVHVLLPVAVD